MAKCNIAINTTIDTEVFYNNRGQVTRSSALNVAIDALEGEEKLSGVVSTLLKMAGAIEKEAARKSSSTKKVSAAVLEERNSIEAKCLELAQSAPDTVFTATEYANECGVSTQKISARLKAMAEKGLIEKATEGTGKAKKVGYKLISE